jgi:hypothetical protein
MTKQFEAVNCKYGAPVGRRESHHIDPTKQNSIRLFKVNVDSQGYDDGGAYWGIGQPLYCAMQYDTDYLEFIRANSRKAAADQLAIPNELLIVKFKV